MNIMRAETAAVTDTQIELTMRQRMQRPKVECPVKGCENQAARISDAYPYCEQHRKEAFRIGMTGEVHRSTGIKLPGLRPLLVQTGKTDEALAREIGIGSESLRRAYRQDKPGVKPWTAEKIYAFFGCAEEDLR